MRVGIMIEGQEGLTWERWLKLVHAAEDLGYESLWTAGTGSWNYITEDYVPRAAELLCELLNYLAELPGRMPEQCFEK